MNKTSYEKSYAKEWAQINAIHLLENLITRLDNEAISLEQIVGDWTKRSFPLLNQQVKIIKSACANKGAVFLLVEQLNALNEHLTYKNRHRAWTRVLSLQALFILNYAIASHDHAWDKIKQQAIQVGFGISHIVKTKGSPWYYNEEEEQEEEEESEQPFAL